MKNGKAVFLDLQGTLGGDGLGDILTFSFFPEAISALRLLNKAGLPVLIVTNQSHIAKGHFTQEEFWKRIRALEQELADRGAFWQAVYCCPHRSTDKCACYKPRPGMAYQARDEFDLHLPDCYVVGDMGASDILLAHHVGCTSVLVRTGAGESSLGPFRYLWADTEPDHIAEDVLAAARWIVARERAITEHGPREKEL